MPVNNFLPMPTEEIEHQKEKPSVEMPRGLKKEPEAFGKEKLTVEVEELRRKIAETEKELARLAGEQIKAEKSAEVGAETKVEAQTEEGTVAKERGEAASAPPLPSKSPAPHRKSVQNLKNLNPQEQVGVLCEMAFDQGIREAIKIARELDNAYVLDAFHDSLVDQLYQKLIEAKKIEGPKS